MKPYVIYKLSTGEITQTGYGPDASIATIAPEGHKAIVGTGTKTAHCVDLATESIIRKRSSRAIPERTAGKVGQSMTLSAIAEGSTVAIRSPGGVVVGRPTPDHTGTVVYIPVESGRHQWEVSHPSSFPSVVVFDVVQ